MTAFVRTTTLIGYRDLVARLHGDPDPLLLKYGIDVEKAIRLEGVILLRAEIRLLEETARRLDCQDFGLQMSEYQDMSVLGPLAVAAIEQPTVGEALRKILDYLHFFSSGLVMRLDPEVTPDTARITFDWTVKLPHRRQIIELTLAVTRDILEMLCADSFQLEGVWLECATPLSPDHYHQFFGAPVRIESGCNGLTFPNHQLQRKIDIDAGHLHDIIDEFVREVVRNDTGGLRAQIESLVSYLLPTQHCTLKLIAEKLHLHPRSLQRRLSNDSLAFEQLIDKVRRQCADEYLAVAEMPISQVAGLVGYSDQSSFNRACRRWFGTTPLLRRRQLASATAIPRQAG